MSRSLDDLARALATPMPRRRALRTLGVAAVGVVLGSRLATGTDRALAHTCDLQVGHGWKYCTQETDLCFPSCCPAERACSVGPRDTNGCPMLVSCCNPCNPAASQPTGDGGCGPGPIGGACCKPDETRCGDDCCRRSEECVNGACLPVCEADEQRCAWSDTTTKRSRAKCCKPGTVCCKPRRGALTAATVTCCPARRCCGGQCCHGSERCAPGGCCRTCGDDGACCKRGETCCGDRCCKRGEVCGTWGSGADAIHICCKTRSCRTGDDDPHCCPSKTDQCVPPWDRGRSHRICCPAERVIRNSSGPTSCCPDGTIALGEGMVVGGGALGACCPEAQACGSGPNRTCCPVQGALRTTCCGGVCADLSNSAANCGECGLRCGPFQGCSNGVCVPLPT